MATTKTHQAAILPQQGGPLCVGSRETPTPGPNEVLIQVKAIAVNPVDYYQRDFGMPPVPIYPAVIGSDVAGIVTQIGADVTTCPAVGSRVLALASAFYQHGSPDHGAFQEFTLAQAEALCPLPDNISFEQGASVPLAALTALSAWTTVGIPLNTRHTPADKQAVLIWGASSSVGTFAVQTARILGFTIYATASARHHAYIRELGAHAVFDYASPDVVSQIVQQVRTDGVQLHTAHAVVPDSLSPVLEVLKAVKGDAAAVKVAHSPLLPADHPTLDNTTILFNFPPTDPAARDTHLADVFHGWLADGLQSGALVPSPKVQIAGSGLEAVNAALETLKAGVSGTKIVVSV